MIEYETKHKDALQKLANRKLKTDKELNTEKRRLKIGWQNNGTSETDQKEVLKNLNDKFIEAFIRTHAKKYSGDKILNKYKNKLKFAD